MAAQLIRKTFPKIRLTYPKGEKFYLVDARRKGTDGKREHFKTKAEAEKRAREIERDFATLGAEGLGFPTELRVMALNCSQQLEAFGKSLNDATQHYVAFLHEQELVNQSRPIAELVDEWYAAKEANVRKPLSRDTLNELKKMGKKLKGAYGARRIRTIQQKDVEDYVDSQKISNQTRSNIVVKWGQFFNWAIEKEYTDFNPCKKVEIYPAGRDIERYDATTIESMLSLAEHEFPDLAPYLAICTFAGVRPSECQKLTWDKINLKTKPPQIEVVKSTPAVNDFTRLVKIETNLAQWLKAYSNAKGQIVPKDFRKQFDAFKICFGFDLKGAKLPKRKWIANGLRHTYASFWLAKYSDVGELAKEIGNSPAMIRKHYNKAVRTEDVRHFWEIRPVSAKVADKREIEGVNQLFEKPHC